MKDDSRSIPQFTASTVPYWLKIQGETNTIHSTRRAMKKNILNILVWWRPVSFAGHAPFAPLKSQPRSLFEVDSTLPYIRSQEKCRLEVEYREQHRKKFSVVWISFRVHSLIFSMSPEGNQPACTFPILRKKAFIIRRPRFTQSGWGPGKLITAGTYLVDKLVTHKTCVHCVPPFYCSKNSNTVVHFPEKRSS